MSKLFVAWFEEEEHILDATKAARAAGCTIHDVYTPYAVHGLDEAMGLRPSRLTWACFGFGATGLTLALLFQSWTSAVDWPLNVGGKPAASIPAFVPVAFELTVLLAALGTVAALFLRAGLRPRLATPDVLSRVTDDRFALALRTEDTSYDERKVRALLAPFHPVEISLVEVER
jgi:hypothetical protein